MASSKASALPAGVEPLWGESSAVCPREESNPFSFKEFVRSKNQNPEPAQRLSLEPEASSKLPSRLDSDEEEDDWSSSYRPSAIEEALSLSIGPSSPSPPWNSRATTGPQNGGDALPPLQSYHELKEENSQLRSRISEVETVSEMRAERVKQLEKTLEENQRKEAKEARDLEAMVQQVEENLRRMTKRASKAESNAVKLKQENALLQVQVENYRLEKEAMKRSADIALHNLLTVLTKSRLSIKQLLSGAEELEIVAEFLKSMDKITEMPTDSL
ncbi:endosome-associated-trafficking regulator 1 [Anolis carolinensis]|uniref:endosome-associated-trafficking regulator 1 n=1 Tax=Anolis carolinensis TaxID=28377 RepID=UPI002F2B5EE4